MASTIASPQHTFLQRDHVNVDIGNSDCNYSHLTEHGDMSLRSYNFRPSKNPFPPFFAAFVVDEDPSSDFDPNNANNLQERQSLVRKVHSFNSGERLQRTSKIPREPKEKVNTWQTGRQHGLLAHVSLNLSSISETVRYSEKGKKVFDLLSQWVNNWPTTDQPTDEDNFSELQIDSICNDRLRQHDRKQHSALENDKDHEASLWKGLSLGHPAARGCKACYELGLECDLVWGWRYPCLTCEEDGNSCELIMEPKRKAACESCTKRRVKCSFRISDDHRGPCKQCTDKGVNCVAGPKTGFTRDGPSLDSPPVPLNRSEGTEKRSTEQENIAGTETGEICDPPAKKRRLVKCISCKENRAFCSLSKNPTANSCGRCRKQGLHCVPDGTSSPTEICGGRAPDPPEVFTRPDKPRHWVYDNNIEFNYKGARECSWCKCESYGFFGPMQNSERLHWAQAQGLLDTANLKNSHSSSQMCIDCVMSRVDVLKCGEHKLCLLEAAPPKNIADNQLMICRLPGYPSLFVWKWCKVCPRPASFRCCCVVNGASTGCGLLLCEDCACSFMVDAQGDLDCLLERKERQWKTETDLRADASFLHHEGPLVQYFVKKRSLSS